MDKKSAIVTAGGLVASFAAGIAAVSLNWGLGTETAAAPVTPSPSPSQTAKVKPIVKHRTITIHRKAHQRKPAPSTSGHTVVLSSSSGGSSGFRPTATSSGSHGAGGENEHEGGDHEGGGEGGD